MSESIRHRPSAVQIGIRLSMKDAYCKLRANVALVGNQSVDMMVNNMRLGLSVNTTVDKKLHRRKMDA